ncbi:MAG: hypothetical protein HKN87_16380 [Saprospiraceae bacterium]|nr:hypothetical protein [Saprospiraceae bacterium]
MQRFEKWTETYLRLSTADEEAPLEPKELVSYALAAYLTGSDAESYEILERAHHVYLDQKKTEQAVRTAFWLGLMLMNAGERARSSGWISRGERILTSEECLDCAEKGLLLLPQAYGALSSGDSSKAQKLFDQAAAIGEKFHDPDLITLGRLGQGQSMIQQGDVADGIRLLDETMISLETEKIFPVAKGIIYCAVIETCRNVWDLGRAQEWTSTLSRWCEKQPDIIPFRGQCLARRAEIIQFHGNWNKALEESEDACVVLTRPPGEPAAGEAFYRKGEILRLLGDFKKAEDSYLEASKWGRKPQPGLALLRLAQGHDYAADASIRNTLKETNETIGRAELLPAFVQIMIAVNHTEEAEKACKELGNIAKQFDKPYLHATYAYCKGMAFLAEGNVLSALEHLQSAMKLWKMLQLPYESACTRELRGLVYRELNDKDNSDVEFAAAKWIFEKLNALPDLARIDRLLIRERHHKTYGLTLRELQVLGQLISGKTNRSMADELFISERTVDRHVSNIFKKLDVSSRVEATAFAIKNKILDDILR